MQRERERDDESQDPCEEPDGGRSQRRTVRLSLFTWERLGALVAVLALGLAFVEDEAVTAGKDGFTLGGHLGLIETLRFSPDGKTLLSSGWDRTVRVWDVRDPLAGGFGQEQARLSIVGEIYAAEFSPDGRTVAVAGLDGLTIWDWQDDGADPRTVEAVGANRSLTFSPDGKTLVLGGFDHQVRLVDVQSGSVKATLGGHLDVVRKLAFTPDARRLISLSYDGRLKTWDLGDQVREVRFFHDLDDAARPILTFALNPVGDLLALSRLNVPSSDQIEIWDAVGGRAKTMCEAAERESHALAFSQDGGVLASCGSDLRIHFWNPKSGKTAGVLEGATGWVRTLDFSADGRWLALSSVPDQVLLKRISLPAGMPVHPATAVAPPRPSQRPHAV
ncbi:WD40 repeat domain-containing protein [Paludisphaera mucosa]|uniref:WD40 repeat domain-containing protein n=1 Tax=Paludisphaera mucosa TaxID=3030827 RepID=A0ABT6FGQ4_9BACT|nr:WD40 repeat domain-containing protein [Paludisphaera mucosa]MDG3006694.1 WD40 repeat domain-containing protein [Paludisphaera mucosa]